MPEPAGPRRRWPAAGLALLVLAGAAAAAEPADPEAGDADAPPPEKDPRHGDERVVLSGEHPYEAWRLPPHWRKDDGSIDQEALVARQKKRLPVLNATLFARLRMVETKHFLVFSDADLKTIRQFAAWGESLYVNLGRQFGIPPTERIWDGKCILLVFARRSLFISHAVTFDRFNASRAGAYFAVEVQGPELPRMVHIAIPLDTRDPRRLQELFAHEGTHAFFQLYRRPVDLPLWLHEGLAEYMTVVNDPALARRKQKWARQVAFRKISIHPMLNRPLGEGLSYREYSAAYTLVDMLVAAGKPKFKAFIHAIKDGKDQAEALRQVYGWDLGELQRRWRVYCDTVLAKGR